MLFKRLAMMIGLMMVVGLVGCGANVEKEEIDPPTTVSYENEIEDAELAQASDETGIITELYLFDQHGYVVPTAVELPNTTSVAKQALDYLVHDGPVTELLPSGFSAVLPAGTTVNSIDVSDRVATVDFSKEFANYDAALEGKILQSVVWTLTQFESVDRVVIQVAGRTLTEMPVAHTPVSKALTREIGINLETASISDVMNTYPVTVYFVKENEENSYYVPVTRRVPNAEKNELAAIVQELVQGPIPGSGLSSQFVVDASLIDLPVLENGVATLNFNEFIYASIDDDKFVASGLLDSLVLSLTERVDVERVALRVNGSPDLLDEDGKALSAPVSRPTKVNTGSY